MVTLSILAAMMRTQPTTRGGFNAWLLDALQAYMHQEDSLLKARNPQAQPHGLPRYDTPGRMSVLIARSDPNAVPGPNDVYQDRPEARPEALTTTSATLADTRL